jgi:hypothetical protein
LGSHYCFSCFWDCGLKFLVSSVFKSIGSQCFIHFKVISERGQSIPFYSITARAESYH